MRGSSNCTFGGKEKQVMDTKPLLLDFDAVSSRTAHDKHKQRKERIAMIS